MRSSDALCDLCQRAIPSTPIFEAVLQNENGMSLATPFADQTNAWAELSLGDTGLGIRSAAALPQPYQSALGALAQATLRLLL
jgi:hypothetical protein